MITFLCPMLLDIREFTTSFEESQATSAFPSDNSSPEMKLSSEHWRNDAEKRKWKYSEKTLLQYPLCTTNLTWTGLASNADFQFNSPATSDLRHGTAFEKPRCVCVFLCVRKRWKEKERERSEEQWISERHFYMEQGGNRPTPVRKFPGFARSSLWQYHFEYDSVWRRHYKRDRSSLLIWAAKY